jgi:multidrug efflux system membrane fusion protein
LSPPKGKTPILLHDPIIRIHPFALIKKLGLLVGVLFIGPILWSCSPERPYDKPPTPVNIQAVQTYTGEDGLRFSGSIKPKTQVELAFRQGGYIQDILQIKGREGHPRPVQEGDWITQGTVLAKLRQEDVLSRGSQIKSQLAEAEASREMALAQLAEVSAGLEVAQLDFERAEFLFHQKSLIKPEYDIAKGRLETAQAKMQAAQAQVRGAKAKVQGGRAALEEGELMIKDAALQAPFNGILIKKNIEIGGLIQPGVPAFILADISAVRVTFGLSDLTIAKLQTISSLTVSVEAIPNKEFKGRISRISPSADPTSRLFEAEITIPNPGNLLKPGMIASVLSLSPTPSKAIMVVPLTAIVRPKGSPTGFAVYICRETSGRSEVHQRSVTLGKSLGNQIEVLNGLQMGEKVVISGAQFLVGGQTVKVVP